MVGTTDSQTDSCLSEENPRKKKRIARQSDVRCSCTCNCKTGGHREWTLALCYGSGQLSFFGLHGFFEDASRSSRLNGMQLGIVYGKHKVDEVSFWSEVDLIKAMEKTNVDQSVSGFPRITLKIPKEALEEMALTEYYWHILPPHLVEEILLQLLPFHWGRIFARVSRSWRNLTLKYYPHSPRAILKSLDTFSYEHVYEGLFIINPYDSANLGTEFNIEDLVEKEVQFDQRVSHLVLINPNKYYLRNWAVVLEINPHIKHLTISKATHFDAADMNFEDQDSTFAQLWRYLERFTCIDCHLTFPYRFGPYDQAWLLTLVVPRLTLIIPEVCRTYADSKDNNSESNDENGAPPKAEKKVLRANIVHQMVTAIKSMDLWWPYPVEQSQWLQKSLEFIEQRKQRWEKDHTWSSLHPHNYANEGYGNSSMTISGYLDCSDRREWRSQKSGNSPTNIVLEKQVLDKMDCAVIGQHLASLKIPGIEPPPYKWENSSFQVTFSDDDRKRGFDKI